MATCLCGTSGRWPSGRYHKCRQPHLKPSSVSTVCCWFYPCAVISHLSTNKQEERCCCALGFERNNCTEHLTKFLISEQKSQSISDVQCLRWFEALGFRRLLRRRGRRHNIWIKIHCHCHFSTHLLVIWNLSPKESLLTRSEMRRYPREWVSVVLTAGMGWNGLKKKKNSNPKC